MNSRWHATDVAEKTEQTCTKVCSSRVHTCNTVRSKHTIPSWALAILQNSFHGTAEPFSPSLQLPRALILLCSCHAGVATGGGTVHRGALRSRCAAGVPQSDRSCRCCNNRGLRLPSVRLQEGDFHQSESMRASRGPSCDRSKTLRAYA